MDDIKISVVVYTRRLGGMDIIKSTLAYQLFPKDQFELILCDYWQPQRKKVVKEYFGDAFQFKHLPDVKSPPNKHTLPIAGNQCFKHARGELIVFLPDYGWASNYYLQKHWELYQKDKRSFGAGPWWTIEPQNVKPNARFDEDNPDNYISVFKNEFQPLYILTPNTLAPYESLPPIEKRHDLRVQILALHAESNWFLIPPNGYLPIELLDELNGFDERLSDCRIYIDTETALRSELAGYHLLFRYDNPVIEVNHSKIGIDYKSGTADVGDYQSEQRQLEFIHKRIEAIKSGKEPVYAPNDFDLRTERAKNLGLPLLQIVCPKDKKKLITDVFSQKRICPDCGELFD